MPNNTLSRADLRSEGIVYDIHYGDVLIKFGSILDMGSEDVPYIANGKEGKTSAQLQDGDIVIADTAEDETAGKAVEIYNAQRKRIEAGLHTIPCRPISTYTPMYLGYYMNSAFYHSQLLSLLQGVKVLSISKANISKTVISLPQSKMEQEKISSVLYLIDLKVKKQRQVIDTLKKYKRGLLNDMFPQKGATIPKLRLAGFTGAWEQRKLGDTNTYFTDGNYGEAYPKPSDMTDKSVGVPFLTGGNLKDGRLDITDASYITKEKHEKLTSGHLVEDDIVIAVRGSLGALGYVNKGNSGWNINSQLAILRTDKTELSGEYLLQFLLSSNGQIELVKRQTGSALRQLPINAIKDVDIPITSIGEQFKIGVYFRNLDHLITLHQHKLDLLMQHKAGVLQQLFI